MAQKLSKKTQNRIATLINSYEVGSMMAKKDKDNGDDEGHALWVLHYIDAMIALQDEFGIVLPSCEFMREQRGFYQSQYDKYSAENKAAA